MSMMRVVALLSILALSPQEPETLDALLRALDGDVPEERDRAEEALLEKGEAALPRLRTEAERASGEPKARLAGIIREIEFLGEERELAKAGLPVTLARTVPRFRERFLSGDERVVLAVLKETFGGRTTDRDPNAWMSQKVEFDPLDLRNLLASVLARARGSTLKEAALRLTANHHDGYSVGVVLARYVDDPDPKIRRALLEAARAMPVPGGEARFGRYLREGSREEQGLALEALSKLQTPDARREMLAALADPAPDVRADAIQALSAVRETAAIPVIRRLLDDPDSTVRSNAVWALQNLRAPEALGAILSLKDDPTVNVRLSVLLVIDEFRDPRGTPAILKALNMPDEDERLVLHAITVARHLKLKEALPVLLDFLKSTIDDRAQSAARAIAEIGPGLHEAELLRMTQGPDALLRKRALLALSSPAPSPEALAAVQRAISDPEVTVREAAVAILGKARGVGVLPTLERALKDEALRPGILKSLDQSPEPDAGRLALEVLKEGDAALAVLAFPILEEHPVVGAIPALERFLDHPEKAVGTGAASALYSVAGPRAFPAMVRALDRATEATQEKMWSYFAINPDPALVETAIRHLPRLPETCRGKALQVIAGYPSARSTEFLAGIARTPDHPDRGLALHALAERGNEEVLETLHRQVRSGRRKEREGAAWVLLEVGEEDDASLQFFWEAMQTTNMRIRRFFLEPFTRRRWPAAAPILPELLSIHDWWDNDSIAKGMALYPKGTFDERLRAMASSPEPDTRSGAAQGLRHVDLPDRLELLRKLLGDATPSVRREAARAFQNTTPKAVPEEFLARFADSDPEVRREALLALAKLDPSILHPRLEALLSDASPTVREEAALTAGRGRHRVSPELLSKLLEDEEGPVRAAAATAIGLLGYSSSGEALAGRIERETDGGVLGSLGEALLNLGDDRGRGLLRSILNRERDVPVWRSALALLEHGDRSSAPAALGFVGRMPHYSEDANRVLFAMNAMTQPELYRKAKDIRVDLPGRKVSERDRMTRLGQALGLKVEIDPGVPEFPLLERGHERQERPVIEELTLLGYHLDAAAILEPGRLRVLRRLDAVDLWERWCREGK
jgi:HEAT repeat protein